jgi:predicted membrane channel-forming protein YqfA (hemolysin III family)
VGGIAYIYGLIVQVIEKDTFNMILHIVGTALIFIGLVLPIKEFFGKKGGTAK